MKHIKKKNKATLLLILTGVMAVLIAGYFILTALLPNGSEQTEEQKYEKLEWEGTSQRVFPDIDTSYVQYITVNASEGVDHASYGLIKTEDGTFSLWYQTEKGVEDYEEYNPAIVSKDPAFKYSSLYAMDSFGQGQVARFFYLRSAITTMYFTERISLEGLTDNEKRSYLEEFGFMDYGDYEDPNDNVNLGVIVQYGSIKTTTASDGTEKQEYNDFHVIRVGGKNVSESGYYVMLDDHPYIYATNNSNIGYATQPYTYYINPAVISAGLAVDAAYEPYLISDYRQWKNSIVSTPGTQIDKDAEVIVKTETTLPANHGKDNGLVGDEGGLLIKNESTSFHLGDLAGKPAYARLLRLLTSQRLTGILNPDTDEEEILSLKDPLYITLVTEGLKLNFPEDATSMTYTYKITRILSALTEDGEALSGNVPADATALRVAFDLYINGSETKENKESLYAVLSLSDDRLAAYADTLRSAKIGENVNISFDIEYDKENTSDIHKKKITLYIADIIAIYDENGKSITKITENSIVSYRYYLEVNGVKQDAYLTAADKVSGMSDENKALFLSLGVIGSGYNREIDSYVEYLDVMQDFISYKITAIPYMIVREEIVHFEFQNASERDPFYGESIYANLMEDERGLYGLNNSSCQSVLLHLGGAGESTTASNGYAGIETIAVGLTPENMRKYGLYAHTIYYELPRGINGIQNDGLAGEEVLDDYTWQNVLGFTVYISDKQIDGSRYIASDLYDVVVRVVDSKLDFVDLGFVDFWARRVLVSTDIDDIDEVQVEFNFEELKGRFDFILKHFDVQDPNKDELVDKIAINVRPGTDAYMNALVAYMLKNGSTCSAFDYFAQHEKENEDDTVCKNCGKKYIDLTQSLVSFYNHEGPEDLLIGGVSGYEDDYSGTYFFKQIIGIMYTTTYLDTYTAEEQAQILATAPMLARISFKLSDHAYKYVYEFYRASDRRVLVKIYQADADGVAKTASVSDFSISTATFKKIMGGFNTVLNAGIVTGDEPFFDFAAGKEK